MLRPKVAEDSTSSSIKSIGNPWHELLKEIHKVDAFDAPNFSLVRGTAFSDSMYDTFEHFWKTNEHKCNNDIRLCGLQILDGCLKAELRTWHLCLHFAPVSFALSLLGF